MSLARQSEARCISPELTDPCFEPLTGGSPLAARGGEEELRSFALAHFLGDSDLAADHEAARGAASYDADEYWVSGASPGGSE